MEINVKRFKSEDVVNGLVNVANKWFDKVSIKSKSYCNKKSYWIRIGSNEFKTEYEVSVTVYYNGEYSKEAVCYDSRPYGDGSRYSRGYYGTVYHNPNDGKEYRHFVRKEGEDCIFVSTDSSYSRFGSSNKFRQNYERFVSSLKSVIWLTGGYVDAKYGSDVYVEAERYYFESSYWEWERLLKDVHFWARVKQRNNQFRKRWRERHAS